MPDAPTARVPHDATPVYSSSVSVSTVAAPNESDGTVAVDRWGTPQSSERPCHAKSAQSQCAAAVPSCAASVAFSWSRFGRA